MRIRVRGRPWAPHQDLYHFVFTRPWWQFFVLVSAAFLGANTLFALAYSLQPGSIANARSGSFEDAFSFSVQTMATIGYGGMSPATRLAHALVTLEALCSILGVALVTGITFAKFARPTARVLFTAKAVVTPRDGVPFLSFRMANARHNRIVEAQLRVILLTAEVTREGEQLRRVTELSLVRDRTPLFMLSWTAMHRIDEQSPFYGEDALERLRQRRGELFLSLMGLDETHGQTIHASCSYSLDDIVWNARFADVLRLRDDGVREIDYTNFHEVVPIPAPHAADRPGA